MISEKQLEANRPVSPLGAPARNAQKSTGPRTEEGRRVSSLNALRHALTAQVSLMTEEDRTAHDEFCTRIVASLAPEGANECDLAQLIAEDRWRLHGIHAVEDNIFALGFFGADSSLHSDQPEVHAALTLARIFLSNSNHFNLLTLYAQRTSRNLERNTKQLRELQTERQARYERELAEAARLKQVSDLLGQPFDPAELAPQNGFVFSKGEVPASPLEVPALSPECAAQRSAPGQGFVFSTAEIDRYIARNRRLKQAEKAESLEWNREKFLRRGGVLAA